MSEYTLHLGDCLDFMRGMDAGSVDLAIVDPPYYRIASEDWDKTWSSISVWASWCGEWGREVARILKDTGSAYLFGDDKNIAYMQVTMDQFKWGLINNIVWSKTNYTALKSDPEALRSFRVQAEERILFYGKDITFPSFSEIRNPIAATPMGRYMRSERERAGVSAKEIAALFPSKTGGMTGCVSNWELGLNFPLKEQYETIRAYLNNGHIEYMRQEYEEMRQEYEEMRQEYEEMRRPFDGQKYTDVWSGPLISAAHKEHPSQKPSWIIKRMIVASSRTGDTVLDPFAGSGTVGVVCMEMGRNYIGVEMDQNYHTAASKRIREAAAQPPLFVAEPQPKPTQGSMI